MNKNDTYQQLRRRNSTLVDQQGCTKGPKMLSLSAGRDSGGSAGEVAGQVQLELAEDAELMAERAGPVRPRPATRSRNCTGLRLARRQCATNNTE